MAHDLGVAKTILDQLGGPRFLAMTGASHLVGDGDALLFSLPARAQDGSNKVRITLTPDDLYTLETFWIRAGRCVRRSHDEGIYADQLAPIFTRITGLYTHL